MKQVLISKEEYDQLLKYKALYENEKSHTETLEAIIDRILPVNISLEDLNGEDEIEILDLTDDKDNIDNEASEIDPRENWTEEQKQDIDRAVSNIVDTIFDYFLNNRE